MDNCKNVYVKRIYMDEDDSNVWDEMIEILHSATKPTAIIDKKKDKLLGVACLTEHKMRKIAEAGGYDTFNMFWDEKAIFGDDFNLKEALKELTIDEIEAEALDKMCDLVRDHCEKDEIAVAVINKRVIEVWNCPGSFFDGCYLKTK